jgi:cytochrome c biogenesis protein CcdA
MLRIHALMRSGLAARNLVLGALFIGVTVTALESVCTGQVYVPTLVLLVKTGQSVAKGLAYLLAYNAMFVLPLVAVFALTYRGLKTEALLAWSKREVVLSKSLLGALFLVLAGLIVWL